MIRSFDSEHIERTLERAQEKERQQVSSKARENQTKDCCRKCRGENNGQKEHEGQMVERTYYVKMLEG